MEINKTQKREMTLTSENSLSDNDSTTVLLAFSSETPVTRNIGGQEYNEILLHGTENVLLDRLNSGAALLFNHNMDAHIGTIESATIDSDRVGRALVRFSSVGLGAEKYAMVQERTLQKVSVGTQFWIIKLPGMIYLLLNGNLMKSAWLQYPQIMKLVSVGH
jgi:hypothetical protein